MSRSRAVFLKTCQKFPLEGLYLDLQWSEHIVSAPHFEAGFASFKMRGGNDMLKTTVDRDTGLQRWDKKASKLRKK